MRAPGASSGSGSAEETNRGNQKDVREEQEVEQAHCRRDGEAGRGAEAGQSVPAEKGSRRVSPRCRFQVLVATDGSASARAAIAATVAFPWPRGARASGGTDGSRRSLASRRGRDRKRLDRGRHPGRGTAPASPCHRGGGARPRGGGAVPPGQRLAARGEGTRGVSAPPGARSMRRSAGWAARAGAPKG
jgi:hypothetical protein